MARVGAIHALDRVTFVIQRGATMAEDLVTEYRYNVFGDLFQTILPEGNVIEYGYDAAGRLTSVERKADDMPESHLERVVYTLDGFGNRVLEEHERWTGTEWEKRSQSAYQYSNRCQLDQTSHGFGGDEATTEYAYDCDGNLERVWDANHPSMGQTEPATTEYAYDELDRLTEVRQPWGGDGGGDVTVSYGYDVQDHSGPRSRTARVPSPPTPTSDRDLMTEEVSEVSGTTTFSYNEHGELTTRTDARSITMTRTVDALDRVTFEDYPGGTLDVTYVYDDPLVAFSRRPSHLDRARRSRRSTTHTTASAASCRTATCPTSTTENSNRTTIGYPGKL